MNTMNNYSVIDFDWIEFIEQSEFIHDRFGKVTHIVYKGIQIHIVKSGNFLQVGAFKFDKESQSDSKLINFFETGGCGVFLWGIINAFENGTNFISYIQNTQGKTDPQTFLKHAFFKGTKSPKELYRF